MKGVLVFLVFAVCFVFATGPALANVTAKEAEALVKEAVVFYKANGKEKAMAEFNKPKGKFDKGELYVFVYDMKATILAHPNKPALVGKNLLEMTDYSGKYFRKEIVNTAAAKGRGWSDYDYQNPVSKKIEHKTTYFEKVDDIIICCGAYK
jgi:cytochrome c